MTYKDNIITNQITECINLLKNIFGHHLLGVYLYGSSVFGGLQKYSDLDLFAVSERATTDTEKREIVNSLLQISGIYMKSSKMPIELTIVVKSEINPWHYPPRFDFQFGEWLRDQFESGNSEPWPTEEMPDLALLITQVLLASKTLVGVNPDKLLATVPYKDVLTATRDGLHNLMAELDTDTRNVLLALARIWSRVATDAIRSKLAAADWVISRLPENLRPVMERAKAICKGEENEQWDDLRDFIKPCAYFILREIEMRISSIEKTGYVNRSLYLDSSS